MIKKKLDIPDIILILANLLPVLGVWFLNWKAYDVFLVYCLESIIIGLFTLVKLGIATLVRKKDWWTYNNNKSLVSGVWFMLFFLLHYGLFISVQMVVFTGFTSFGNAAYPDIMDLLRAPGKYLGTDAWIMLGGMVTGYGITNLAGFVVEKEYRTRPMSLIMFEPYMRVIVQQFTVILGSLVLSLGGGKVFILIFAIVKTFFTVFVSYKKMEGMDKVPIAYSKSNSHS